MANSSIFVMLSLNQSNATRVCLIPLSLNLPFFILQYYIAKIELSSDFVKCQWICCIPADFCVWMLEYCIPLASY